MTPSHKKKKRKNKNKIYSNISYNNIDGGKKSPKATAADRSIINMDLACRLWQHWVQITHVINLSSISFPIQSFRFCFNILTYA